MPGYCTLIARRRPSRASAACTWPIEAAAIGVNEKREKCCVQSLPQLASSTVTSWLIGIGWASARRRARIWLSSGVHRQELAHLHRRAAQLGQLVGHPAGVGGGEQQLAHRRAPALGQLAQALGEHAAGHAGSQAAQPGEAGDAAARHRGAGLGGGRCHRWAPAGVLRVKRRATCKNCTGLAAAGLVSASSWRCRRWTWRGIDPSMRPVGAPATHPRGACRKILGCRADVADAGATEVAPKVDVISHLPTLTLPSS